MKTKLMSVIFLLSVLSFCGLSADMEMKDRSMSMDLSDRAPMQGCPGRCPNTAMRQDVKMDQPSMDQSRMKDTSMNATTMDQAKSDQSAMATISSDMTSDEDDDNE